MVSSTCFFDVSAYSWLLASNHRCEYILYRGLYRTAYARVSRGIVTDTELQIGQFVLPKRGFEPVSQSKESRLLRSWKEDLPEDHVRKLVSHQLP